MDERTNTEKNSGVKMKVLSAVLLIGLASVFLLGSVTVTTGDTFVEITSLAGGTVVYYEDIVSLELVENMEVGEKLSGSLISTVLVGKYKNDTLGEYELYAYKDVSPYVVAKCVDRTVVFSLSSTDGTKNAYDNMVRLKAAM